MVRLGSRSSTRTSVLRTDANHTVVSRRDDAVSVARRHGGAKVRAVGCMQSMLTKVSTSSTLAFADVQ